MTMFGAAGAGSASGKQRMERHGIPEAASSRVPGSIVALASAPGNPFPSDIPSRLGGDNLVSACKTLRKRLLPLPSPGDYSQSCLTDTG